MLQNKLSSRELWEVEIITVEMACGHRIILYANCVDFNDYWVLWSETSTILVYKQEQYLFLLTVIFLILGRNKLNT